MILEIPSKDPTPLFGYILEIHSDTSIADSQKTVDFTNIQMDETALATKKLEEILNEENNKNAPTIVSIRKVEDGEKDQYYGFRYVEMDEDPIPPQMGNNTHAQEHPMETHTYTQDEANDNQEEDSPDNCDNIPIVCKARRTKENTYVKICIPNKDCILM